MLKQATPYLRQPFSILAPRSRQLLKQVQNSGGTHLVVDCSTASIYQVLKQAQQIGMVTRYYHFFFTNLVSQGTTLLTGLWLAAYKRPCSVNPAQTTPDITP